MSSRCPQRLCRPTVMNGGLGKLEGPRQPSGAQAQPLHPQPLHPLPLHPQPLHQQQLSCARVQASLSRFTTCTVPASCRARSRFLNLRDSVKKSPTKSTAKVVGGCPTARQQRQQLPWVPLTGNKVLVTGSGAEDLVNTASHTGVLRRRHSQRPCGGAWGRVELGLAGSSLWTLISCMVCFCEQVKVGLLDQSDRWLAAKFSCCCFSMDGWSCCSPAGGSPAAPSPPPVGLFVAWFDTCL